MHTIGGKRRHILSDPYSRVDLERARSRRDAESQQRAQHTNDARLHFWQFSGQNLTHLREQGKSWPPARAHIRAPSVLLPYHLRRLGRPAVYRSSRLIVPTSAVGGLQQCHADTVLVAVSHFVDDSFNKNSKRGELYATFVRSATLQLLTDALSSEPRSATTFCVEGP